MEVGQKTEKSSILANGEFKGTEVTLTITKVEPEGDTLKDKNVWLLSDKKYTPGNTGNVSPEDVARVVSELINDGAEIETNSLITGFP